MLLSADLYLVMHLPKTAGNTPSANFRGNRKSEWPPIFPTASDHKIETLRAAINAELAQHKAPRTRCAFGHRVYWGIHEKIRPHARPLHIAFLRDRSIKRLTVLWSARQIGRKLTSSPAFNRAQA